MIINSGALLILLILAIFFNSALGILLPLFFHVKNIIFFQINLTALFSLLTTYLVLRFIDKKLSLLHKAINKNIEDNSNSSFSNQLNKCHFKNICHFIDNIEPILNNYNNLIIDKDVLLKKYSLLNDKLKKNNRARETMLEVSNSIIDINNTEDLFKLIIEKLIDIIEDANKASFLILNENNLLEYKAAIGYDLSKLKNINLKLEETFLWKENNGNITKPCIIKDIRSFNSFNINKDTYNALDNIKALDVNTSLSTPIIINNKLYGMINIDSFNINAFKEEDLMVAEYFSNQISIAIKNHQLIEKTMYLSKYDSMTNTYNRCYFEQLLNDFYKKACRYNENFCIAMFDLNSLKQLNDTFGHAVGDIVISTFARVIQNNIRESDLLARYGGDEFIGIFFNSNPEDINNRLENMIKYFNDNPLNIKDKKVNISFSYGIACFPQESKNLHYLIKLADKRMYKHKKILKAR